VWHFNEYDRLWFVACVGSTAVPVAGPDAPPFAFDVTVPAGASAGPLTVRLLGVYEGAVAVWERSLTLAAQETSTTSTLPRTGAASAQGPWQIAGLLVVSGVVLLVIARTRDRGRLPGR
jgi:hypothetical protein